MVDEKTQDIDDEVIPPGPSSEEGLDDEGEEFEPVHLSPRQWVYVSLTIFVSFFVFTVIFFPLEDLVRFALYRNVPGISLDQLELNYLGEDHIRKLAFHQAGVSINASSVDSGLSWLALGRRSLKGPLVIRSVELSHSLLSFKAAKIKLDMDIGPLDFSGKSERPLNGEMKLLLQSVTLGQIAPLGIEAGLIKIKEARIHVAMEDGAVDLRHFHVKSNAFRIDIKNASLGASRSLATAPLRGKLCLTPTAALREDEKLAGLRTLYELSGGNINERFCTDLTGTFGKPGIKTRPPAFSTEDTGENPQNPGVEPTAPTAIP